MKDGQNAVMGVDPEGNADDDLKEEKVADLLPRAGAILDLVAAFLRDLCLDDRLLLVTRDA